MTFTRSLTADQLDRGEGMSHHPVSGGTLCGLYFCASNKCLYLHIFTGGWSCDPSKDVWYGRISDGKDVKAGDPFHAHWRYDPFTGEKL